MKKPLLLLSLSILCLVSTQSWGQRCISGNCVNGHGTYMWPDGSKYVGEWKDGKRTRGINTRADGTSGDYTGSFCPGSYNSFTWHNCIGYGIWPDGKDYFGKFENGRAHGQGDLTWPDGSKYVGEFRDGKRDGQGTFTSIDGDQYVGEWKDDKRTGQGTFTLEDGRKYVGGFKDGKFHGQGTMTWSGEFYGQIYVGEWKDDKYNGQGTLTDTGGVQWVGCWKDNKKGYTLDLVTRSRDRLLEEVPPEYAASYAMMPLCPDGPSSEQTQEADDGLSEFEKDTSANDLGMFVVYAEECADNYLMEKADSEAFVKALEGMIDRGISEGRVSRQEVNEGVNNTKTMIAMSGFGYEQQEMCQMLTMLNSQISQPKDRY